MSSSNTSSFHLPPPPPSLESNNPTKNMYDSYSNSSSSTGTKKFGSHAPAIRKAMKMLEAQFGHPHISLASSSSSSINKNIGVDGVATEGVDVGNGNKSKRKPKTKTFNHGRIRSLPHPKYGPYTCSKCFEVLPTSQKFANHVTSHYKAQIKSNVQCDQSDLAHINDEAHNQIALAPPLSGFKLKIESTDN
ncbi:zinc finger family protein [Trifolium pratense]|uniref:Zinc finger family protein n=1 Tax=Trifolium pratense TaxID=57577 RepID=A0A2K3MLJ0_TRIPR|nr:zinc finger family protein [Trifolium pratense]